MKKNNTFERFESKYLLTEQQLDGLKHLLNKKLEPDLFPKSIILSVYFDTDDYRVIRESIDAKLFKEKLRIRKYIADNEDGSLFLEIKRKVDGVVYKRRKALFDIEDVDRILSADSQTLDQIEHEIQYVFHRNPGLKPRVLIRYNREAFKAIGDDSFRLTVDTDIRARFDCVTDFSDSDGNPMLDHGMALMEVKTRFGYPRWFLDFLEVNRVRKQSFSKYGTAYKQQIRKTLHTATACSSELPLSTVHGFETGVVYNV